MKCKDRIAAPYAYVVPHLISDEPRITIDLDGPNLPEKETSAGLEELSVQEAKT